MKRHFYRYLRVLAAAFVAFWVTEIAVAAVFTALVMRDIRTEMDMLFNVALFVFQITWKPVSVFSILLAATFMWFSWTRRLLPALGLSLGLGMAVGFGWLEAGSHGEWRGDSRQAGLIALIIVLASPWAGGILQRYFKIVERQDRRAAK